MLYYSILNLKSSKYNIFINLLEKNDSYEEKINEKIDKLKKSNFSSDINLKDLYHKSEFEFEFEEIELLNTFGTWYKCPNGHYYMVTECGRPTQESECPECHSRIGGLNHILDEHNTRINLYGNSSNFHNDRIRNILLDQDDEVYNDMNNNNDHPMDPEVEEAIRNNPEMSEYN